MSSIAVSWIYGSSSMFQESSYDPPLWFKVVYDNYSIIHWYVKKNESMASIFYFPGKLYWYFEWYEANRAVLHGNVVLSIIVLSTKISYSSFFKKVSIFEKTWFQGKLMKTFKITSDWTCTNNCFSLLIQKSSRILP